MSTGRRIAILQQQRILADARLDIIDGAPMALAPLPLAVPSTVAPLVTSGMVSPAPASHQAAPEWPPSAAAPSPPPLPASHRTHHHHQGLHQWGHLRKHPSPQRPWRHGVLHTRKKKLHHPLIRHRRTTSLHQHQHHGWGPHHHRRWPATYP